MRNTESPRIRSPLPWLGGKYRMAQFILAAFPDTSMYDTYVEPFAGACHVLLQKPLAHQYEVVNDVNGDLVRFWMTMRDSPNILEARLATLPYSRALHYEYHKSLFDGSNLEPLERVVRWFYVMQSSFSSHMKQSSTGWKNGARDIGRGQPHSFHSALALFEAVAERLKYVEIDNRDFESVINQHDGKRTLFCVDPPYLLDLEKDYYKRADGGVFTLADHQRLAVRLNLASGYVALSYYDRPELAAWYPASKWRRLTWRTHKHSQRTRVVRESVDEILLLNYPTDSRQLSLFDSEICDLTISLSSPVTHILSTIWLSSLLDGPHRIRPVLILTHICACRAFFEP